MQASYCNSRRATWLAASDWNAVSQNQDSVWQTSVHSPATVNIHTRAVRRLQPQVYLKLRGLPAVSLDPRKGQKRFEVELEKITSGLTSNRLNLTSCYCDPHLWQGRQLLLLLLLPPLLREAMHKHPPSTGCDHCDWASISITYSL